MSANVTITMRALNRLPQYLSYLKSIPKDDGTNISATSIAEALGLNDVQVRKDLAAVSNGGKSKVGYNVKALMADIEGYLGFNDTNNAVIVGVGNLGRALLSYDGFKEYGLDIVAGFDKNESVVGSEVNGKIVLPIDELTHICRRMKIHIGIIAVPSRNAQEVCDTLISSGIMAIWNFANTHISVPEGVLLQNENMATSLALLSTHLAQKIS